jgi:hypothetical protein
VLTSADSPECYSDYGKTYLEGWARGFAKSVTQVPHTLGSERVQVQVQRLASEASPSAHAPKNLYLFLVRSTLKAFHLEGTCAARRECLAQRLARRRPQPVGR